jgi:hypothetical protein
MAKSVRAMMVSRSFRIAGIPSKIPANSPAVGHLKRTGSNAERLFHSDFTEKFEHVRTDATGGMVPRDVIQMGG